jgi:hypothetical protein
LLFLRCERETRGKTHEKHGSSVAEPLAVLGAPYAEQSPPQQRFARRGECGMQALEVNMTTVKGLAIIALLVGGTSLALAQGPPTGGYPPVSGGAGGNPAVPPAPPGPGVIPHDVQSTAPSPNLRSAAPATGTRIVHHHMYMSAHRKTLKTGQQPQ